MVYMAAVFANASLLRIHDYAHGLTWTAFLPGYTGVFLHAPQPQHPGYVHIPASSSPARRWLAHLHAARGRAEGPALVISERPLSASVFTEHLRVLAACAEVLCHQRLTGQTRAAARCTAVVQGGDGHPDSGQPRWRLTAQRGSCEYPQGQRRRRSCDRHGR